MYKMSKTILLISIFLSAACLQSSEVKENKIRVNDLCNVLIDLHFASTAKSLNLLNPKDTFPNTKVRNIILKQHKITQAQLEQCIEYYSQKPDSLSIIYSIMIERISTKQAQMR
jgi:uncharacterized protein YpiB (UPF0302 family)